MAQTKIEWADAVWNPVVGCTKVSQGCAHCFAERMAKRLKAMGRPEYQDVVTDDGRWNRHVTCLPDRLDDPFHWKKPRRVFVNSMSDLFHEGVPDDFIFRCWTTMAAALQHTFIILTKRPERMADWTNKKWWIGTSPDGKYDFCRPPLPNVWLGVSVEDQKTADERIPWLLKTNAAVRVVSVEPMLGQVDLKLHDYAVCGTSHSVRRQFLHWIIAGCESGPNARPASIDWFRSLRDQCVSAGVPFFLKQSFENGKLIKMPLLDGRKWEEYPNGK